MTYVVFFKFFGFIGLVGNLRRIKGSSACHVGPAPAKSAIMLQHRTAYPWPHPFTQKVLVAVGAVARCSKKLI